jgi:hypothetical protein
MEEKGKNVEEIEEEECRRGGERGEEKEEK